jgi:uncharacterized protein (DUF885 family)
MATRLGEHSFDGLLPETGAENIERNAAFLRDMRSDFSALPGNELGIDERIDRESIIQQVNQQLFLDEDLQYWKRGTDLAMNIGEAIFILYSRDFAPLTDRVISIISRLRAIPFYLGGSKNLFQKVPIICGEIYLESLASLPVFLDNIEASLNGRISPVLLADYRQAVLAGKKALAEFSSWLRHAILPKSDNNWAIGPGAYQAMLAIRKLGSSQNEILEIARQAAQNAAERLDRLGSLILGASTGSATGARDEVKKRMQKRAPQGFDQSIAAYQEAMNRTRAFVASANFATIPANECLEIVETPEFMAHLIPFSAYIAPERLANQQTGIYMITREGGKNKGSYAEIINAAIHEGYPGHHLQFTAHSKHPGLIRAFCENLELLEGWARYCQRRVREMGFESSTESHFAHAESDLFDATRAISDINLHTRNWSHEQAVTYLAEKNHISRAQAVAEINRQILEPGQQISGIIGEHRLLEIQSSLKQRFRNDFSDKSFHDLILYQGAIPVHVAQQFCLELMQNTLKTGNGF